MRKPIGCDQMDVGRSSLDDRMTEKTKKSPDGGKVRSEKIEDYLWLDKR